MLKHEDIKVSFYLDKLLVHLKAVAALDDQTMHTIGAKFVAILAKVKVWFQQQGKPPKPVKEETRPAAGFEPPRLTEPKREGPPQYTDKFNFLTDFSKAPTMNATTWPNQFQSPNGYTSPNYAVQPSWNDVAFDFPMDLDPNLFTHLIQADQTQNYQDNESSSNAGPFNQMGYLNNMPQFGHWPTQ